MEERDFVIPKPASKKQELILSNESQVLVIGGAMGGGKVQPNSSVVHTKFGTKLIEDLVVGDKILNPNGTEQKVLQIFPHKDHQFYEVTFDDGATTYCGLEHLWVAWRASKQTKKQKKLNDSGETDTSLFPNSSEVISLAGIIDWMDRGYKPLIPVSKPLPYTRPSRGFLDPYVLGVLLGDGCISRVKGLNITRDLNDNCLDERLSELGYPVHTIDSDSSSIFFDTEAKVRVVRYLESYNLIGTYSDTKFIPDIYQTLPVRHREALLQGLMDTDGYVDDRGHLEYTTVSKKLSEGVTELVRGLGGKSTVSTKVGSYKNSEGNKVDCKLVYRHYIKLPPCVTPFKMQRKLDRYVPNNKRLYRRIVSVTKAFVSDGACITVSDPNRLYITDDCVVTHNTYLQQLIGLKYVDDPQTRIVNFRRTMNEITGQGGVYDTAKEIYLNLHPSLTPRFVDSKTFCEFPTGANAKWTHMEYMKDTRKNQGLQFTLCNFDEGTTFEWPQIEYMFQRMRSKSKYPSRMVISCNPDPDHELCKIIEWYLDEDGYPIPEREGVERYFIRRGGEFIWGDTREELAKKYDIPEKDCMTKILSFSFVGCTVYDNPPNMESNPEYVAFLEGMNEVDKARNLHGCWYARPSGSNYFDRNWLEKVEELPRKTAKCRAWDKAGTEPSDTYRYPDYTASIRMEKDKNGFYYIIGNYHPSNKDEDSDIWGRFRRRAGTRDTLILNQAELDGNEVTVVLPKDPSAAGLAEYQESAKRLVQEGFIVKADPMPNNKSKLLKFQPFASACENGLVRIVESSFPNQATLEHFYKELEAFTDARSTSTRKDDLPDACASAFNYICRQRVYKCVARNQIQSNTLAKEVLDNYDN